MTTDDSVPWDNGVRSKRYSIVTKRRKLDSFRNRPNRARLRDFADSWWATRWRRSIDYYVDELFLRDGTTPVETLNRVNEVLAGQRSISEADVPGMGVPTLTEVLETIDPDRFVALNEKSREAMEALGYDVPNPQSLATDRDYWMFVEDVKDAVDQFDLRHQLREADVPDRVPDDVADADVAEVAFQMHAADQLDLGEVRLAGVNSP